MNIIPTMLKSTFCCAAALLSSLFLTAETILFEDHFDGMPGTLLPVGHEENYVIAEQTGAVLEGTYTEEGLLLGIGPNTDGANRFAILHHRQGYPLEENALMFEFDLDLGNVLNFDFGLGNWLGIDNYANYSNTFSIRFRSNHNRLAIRTRAEGSETILFDTGVGGFMDKQFRFSLIINDLEFEIFVDGESVFAGPHGLHIEAFAEGAYPGFQMFGGGNAKDTVLLEWYRVVANPEGPSVRPRETRVVFEDDFSGYGEAPLPVGTEEAYRIATQSNAVLTPFVMNDQLHLSIGPNLHGDGNRFAVLHVNQPFSLASEPHLFEFDIELGDPGIVVFGLGTWLGIDNYANFGNTFHLRFRNSHDRIDIVVNDADARSTTVFDTGVGNFQEKKFSVSLWIDAVDVALFVDGQPLFQGPHGLDTVGAFAGGAYAGFQMHGGGDWATHTSVFDNFRVTASAPVPEIEIGEIFWTARTAIRTSGRDGSNPRTLVSGLNRPIGIAIDPLNDHLYWVEDGGARLMRSNLDGTEATEIISPVSMGQFLVIDPEEERLYWAEWNSGLYTAKIDGSDQEQLLARAAGLQSTSVAYDPHTGTAYLGSALGEIFAVDMETGDSELMALFSADSYGLALSPDGNTLYLTNFSDGSIKAYGLETESRTDLFHGRSRPLGITTSATGNTLYWAERTMDDTNGNIVMAAADGSGEVTVLVSGEDSPFGIAVMPVPTDDGISFAEWIATFGLEGGHALKEAAPAGDGIPNLLKFALGLDPGVSSREKLPFSNVIEIEGRRYLTFWMSKNHEAVGVTRHIEVSSDLKEWYSAESMDVIEETEFHLKIRDEQPFDEYRRRFFRLRVTSP